MKKLKLTTLSEAILKVKETNAIKGGNICNCSCYLEGKGGSPVNDNRNANYEREFHSVHGCNQYFKYDIELDTGDGQVISGTFPYVHE